MDVITCLFDRAEDAGSQHLCRDIADGCALARAGMNFPAACLCGEPVQVVRVASAADDVNTAVGASVDLLKLLLCLCIALCERSIDNRSKLSEILRYFLACPTAVILDLPDHAVRREEALVIRVNT